MDAIAANAVADALDALAAAIRTSTQLPGESSKTTAPKAKPAKSARKPRSPRSGKARTTTQSKAPHTVEAIAKMAATSLRDAERMIAENLALSNSTTRTPRKPKAARSPRKVESVVEPGDLTIVTEPTGKAKPSAKQTVRKRFEITYTNAEGVDIRHRTRFRFYRKAEQAADLLRNRGIDVTITPVNVPFKRRSKTSRQKRTAAKAASN